MNPVTISGLAAMLLVSATLASCATTVPSTTVSIRQNPGSYQDKGSVAVATDIKSMLAAGGLNTADPASPLKNTKPVELAKASDKTKVDQLVASLQANGPVALVPAPPLQTASPTRQQYAAKPVQVASRVPTPALTPAVPQTSAVTALANDDHDTITEVTYQFPPIGPNLKPGQTINTEPMAVPSVAPVAATTPALPDPATFKQETVAKKVSRPQVVYAQPTVRRF